MQIMYDPCFCDVHGNPPGDHVAIKFFVNCRKPARVRKEIVFRRLRHIRLPYFKLDTTSLLGNMNSGAPVSNIVATYNTGLRRIVAKQAPLRMTTITLRPDCLWYTDEFRDVKSVDSELSAHGCKLVLTQCVVFNRMLVNTKKIYYTAKIANCKNYQKLIFNITISIMGNNGITTLPSDVCPVDMAQRFGDHFIEKVSNIRKDIVNCSEVRSYTTMTAMSNDAVLVERLVASAPVKSCELVPIPAWLLKQCSYELVPLITATINASLTTSNVRTEFKHAIVKPLLKKTNAG